MQEFFPAAEDPLIFPEDPSSLNNDDLETLPSSCYASAKENISKSEVDHQLSAELTDSDATDSCESHTNSQNTHHTSTISILNQDRSNNPNPLGLKDKRRVTINESVSSFYLRMEFNNNFENQKLNWSIEIC